MNMVCPFCNHEAPESSYAIYALPPGKEGYAQVYRCRKCQRFFAPIDNYATDVLNCRKENIETAT